MADIIEDNAAIYNNKNATQPSKYNNIVQQPGELIDSSVFTLDFTERKFIYIGLDFADAFNISIRITSATRYVCISKDLLRRIYSMMGYILSIISDQPVKSRERLFLKDETITLCKTAYRGENYLALDSHLEYGCRVLLSRHNLLKLQGMEACINETITRKMSITRALVINQLERIALYLKSEFAVQKICSVSEIETVLLGIHPDLFIMHTPMDIMEPCYIIQIITYARTQLAQSWLKKLNDPITTTTTTTAEITDAFNMVTAAAAAIDENDGPSYFNYVNY